VATVLDFVQHAQATPQVAITTKAAPYGTRVSLQHAHLAMEQTSEVAAPSSVREPAFRLVPACVTLGSMLQASLLQMLAHASAARPKLDPTARIAQERILGICCHALSAHRLDSSIMVAQESTREHANYALATSLMAITAASVRGQILELQLRVQLAQLANTSVVAPESVLEFVPPAPAIIKPASTVVDVPAACLEFPWFVHPAPASPSTGATALGLLWGHA